MVQELLIIFSVLMILVVVLQLLLYRSKNKDNNTIFALNFLMSLLISCMAYTSLPDNYTTSKMIVIGIGMISVLAVVLRLIKKVQIRTSNIILTVSIICSLIMMFFNFNL